MKTAVLLLFLSVYCVVSAQNSWFPYEENGRIGWKTVNGKGHILPSTITSVGFPFIYTTSGKAGLIDSSGKLIIDTMYTSFSGFQEDSFTKREGLKYYKSILRGGDKFFLFSTDPKLRSQGTGGCAITEYKYFPDPQTYGIMDRTGKIVLAEKYGVISKLTDDLLVCRSLKDYTYQIWSLSKQAFLPGTFKEVLGSELASDLIIAVPAEAKTNAGQPPLIRILNSEGKEIFRYRSYNLPYTAEGHTSDGYDYPVSLIQSDNMEYVFVKGVLKDSIPIKWVRRDRENKYGYANESDDFIKAVDRTRLYKIYDRYVVYTSGKGSAVYDKKGDTLIWSPDLRFHGMNTKDFYDENHIYTRSKKGKYGVATLYPGEIILPAIYDSILKREPRLSMFSGYLNGKKVWFDNSLEPLDFHGYEALSTYTEDDLGSGLRSSYYSMDHSYILLRSEDGKYGLADHSGNIIIEPQYEAVFPFSRGFSARSNGKWGFLNKQGKVIVPFEFDKVWTHNEDFIYVLKNGKTGLRSFANEILFPEEYKYIETHRHYFTVYKEDKISIVSLKGETLISFDDGYSSVNWLTGNLAELKKGDHLRVYNLSTRKYITKKKRSYSIHNGEKYPVNFRVSEGDFTDTLLIYPDPQGNWSEVITTDGTVIAKNAIERFPDKIIVRKGKNKKAIVGLDGKPFIKGRFDNIGLWSRNIIDVRKGEEFLYYDCKSGKQIVPGCKRLLGFVNDSTSRENVRSYYCLTEKGRALVDSAGNRVIATEFDSGEELENGYHYRLVTELKLMKDGKEFRYSGFTGELTEVKTEEQQPETKPLKVENILPKRPEISGEWMRFRNVWKGTDGNKIYWINAANEVYHITYL